MAMPVSCPYDMGAFEDLCELRAGLLTVAPAAGNCQAQT
jgi:hypothetical protein